MPVATSPQADGNALEAVRHPVRCQARGPAVIKAVAAAAVVVTALPLLVILLTTASQDAPVQAAGADLSGVPITLARADIPADYLTWYISAAQTCPGLPWPILAGIG